MNRLILLPSIILLFVSMASADDRYIDNGSCITDTQTGLVWSIVTDNEISSKEVSSKLFKLNSNPEKMCGVQSWTLPTGEEFKNIIDSYPNLKYPIWIRYRLLRKDGAYGYGGLSKDRKLIKDSYFNHFIAVGKAIGKK